MIEKNVEIYFDRLVWSVHLISFRYEHLLAVGCSTVVQFVTFKPLSYCFKETIGFDVNASFASRL